MKSLTALSMIALLASTLAVVPVCAADPSDQIPAPGQPFLHPSNDKSYSTNRRDDEARSKVTPIDNGQVQYISGGVGDADMMAMETEAHAYNLKILFSAEGKYIANVGVNIVDGKGNSLLDIVAEGPLLLVKLPPGRYMVNTTGANGSMLSQRVQISRDHLSSYVLRYPVSEL